MRYRAIATDYDGTIAYEGVVDDETVVALRRARAAGLQLILVTGRELGDLFNVFPHPDIFDCVVAENGAVLYEPGTGKVKTLCPPAPPQLVRALQRQQVPISVGHAIVATVVSYERQVLDAIRELGLEWHVIFNKKSVMALPVEINKATGLAAAAAILDLLPEQTIGVGDAENDQVFLEQCGLAVAVDNALPAVREMAGLVTTGACGDGVRELITQLLAGRLET
jgi:hydroxymethylpyrimidine pyrophosphatase-like HAD family hydrolase